MSRLLVDVSIFTRVSTVFGFLTLPIDGKLFNRHSLSLDLILIFTAHDHVSLWQSLIISCLFKYDNKFILQVVAHNISSQ